ncbi:MAG: HDIG domain-containing protein [Desulfobacteraceae bacterium]|nr:MAG: HDIG domain-containing protein [Desulfobacteraceae bacterium]
MHFFIMKTGKEKFSIHNFFQTSVHVKWALVIGVVVIFTLVLSPNLIITAPNYKIGDVADRDIKAPKDFMVEDKEATEESQRRAAEGVLTVYDHDAALSSKLNQRVSQAFTELREIMTPKPPAPADKQAVQPPPPPTPAEAENEEAARVRQAWQMKPVFEEKMGTPISKGAFALLVQETFSKESADYIGRILTEVLDAGVVSNMEILLRESDKGIILRTVGSKSEAEVHGLKRFYGLDQAKTMVRIVGQPILKDLDYNLRNLIIDFCQRLIQPNITLNRNETEERKKAATEKIQPTMYQIRAGEMLLREGEVVTEFQLLKLNMLQGQAKGTQQLIGSIGAAIVMLCLLLTATVIYLDPRGRSMTELNRNFLFTASVLVFFILMAKLSDVLAGSISLSGPVSVPPSALYYGIPIASGAMVVCIFLGLRAAAPFAMILSIATALIFQNRLDIFIYFLISSSMGAYWLQCCRERKVFIRAGLKLGLLNIVLACGISLFRAEFAGFKLLFDSSFAFIGGVSAGIITAGFAPLLEIAFGYTTDITLLELANLDRPILRRLMIEAPGSYHHSVIVGSMVEAAAADIGANSLLAKVCGYYHDIGKVKKPLYFIENQTDGKNKHDKLAPSMSSLILISHVKDGVETAKENKLVQPIIDTIRQHHGTSLIRFFFEKAKQQKGEAAVNIDNFRYPGPKPQSRETALVMLADVVEAASRTLENPTPSRIQGHVQNLINKVFSDGQLDDCELSLKDLHLIAKSFNKILNGIHHHRIEYPENGAAVKGKGKNGSADRQQPIQLQDISAETEENGTGHLRRLGIT